MGTVRCDEGRLDFFVHTQTNEKRRKENNRAVSQKTKGRQTLHVYGQETFSQMKLTRSQSLSPK